MSTKITQAAGDDWHFYLDVNDEDHIFLEFEGGATTRIPIEVWNEMVKAGHIERDSWS